MRPPSFTSAVNVLLAEAEVDASPHFSSKNGVSLMTQLWREVQMRYFKHESHEKV